MINVSEFLFPVYGSFYNPEITGIITIILGAVIVSLWGPKTLASFRGRRLVRQGLSTSTGMLNDDSLTSKKLRN
jgi:hypothetical protein